MKNKEEEMLIQSVIDHLLYLPEKDKALYMQEIRVINQHFVYKNRVNYDIESFKIDLKHAI